MADYRYRDPRDIPPFSYSLILLVSLIVEGIRYLLHPDLYQAVAYPRVLFSGAVVVTLGFHVWSLPETRPQMAVSALLTQMAMPELLLILWSAARELGVAFANAVIRVLSKLTEINP